MLIRVNKASNAKKPVKYAALSSGTISHVWCDEETLINKRPNRIKLTREQQAAKSMDYDA